MRGVIQEYSEFHMFHHDGSSLSLPPRFVTSTEAAKHVLLLPFSTDKLCHAKGSRSRRGNARIQRRLPCEFPA